MDLMNVTMGSSLMEPSLLEPKTRADRPIERVRFATPQAKKRYMKILRHLQQNAKKSSRSNSLLQMPLCLQTSDDDTSCFNSNKKRTYSSDNSAQVNSKKSRSVTGLTLEDPFIASLGPIPPANSDIFANTSFVLCYASDSAQCVSQNHECKHVEGWKNQPFYSEDRLTVQINAGGGKVYENFHSVPQEEHERTKLITNAPSLHPQRVYCAEAGIPAYSHRWIINCCKQNKPLDPSQDKIPTLPESGCATCCESW